MWATYRDARQVAGVMAVALAVGALLVAAATPTWKSAFAGLLWAAACSSVGWFLGFLFGIPRSLSTDTARTSTPARPADGANEAGIPAPAASAGKAQRGTSVPVAGADGNGGVTATKPADGAADAAAGADRPDDRQHGPDVSAEAGPGTGPNVATVSIVEKSAARSAVEPAGGDGGPGSDALPRSVSATASVQPSAGGITGSGPSTAVNTNLEQISDWLTKIIVGVTLVESREVLIKLSVATDLMARSIGGAEAKSLALAIVIYFFSSGLLGSYLLTRLFLQRAFTEAASSAAGGGH